MILGLRDLKPRIAVTATTVECPVKGCNRVVERQRHSFRCDVCFQCPDHKIYISPSTFEYAQETDNLLWRNKADLELLQAIKTVKRESRIARDNSEDALTWNLFRYLENTNQLGRLLSHITQINHSQTELIYWSYCQKARGASPELNKARREFGENLQRSSEPDLIAVTDKALFFIEAKLTATNDTQPSDPNNCKGYLTGGDEWCREVFRSDFDTIAIGKKKYELFRFWLLGSWLAKEMKRDFYLLNIVRHACEEDIEARFHPLIEANQHRQFRRVSWEEIYNFVSANAPENEEKARLVTYFQNKTIGYDLYRHLQKAFTI